MTSVTVYDLDVIRIAAGPPEADAPLIVDPDTMLAGAVAFSFSSRLPGGTRPDRSASVLRRRCQTNRAPTIATTHTAATAASHTNA